LLCSHHYSNKFMSASWLCFRGMSSQKSSVVFVTCFNESCKYEYYQELDLAIFNGNWTNYVLSTYLQISGAWLGLFCSKHCSYGRVVHMFHVYIYMCNALQMIKCDRQTLAISVIVVLSDLLSESPLCKVHFIMLVMLIIINLILIGASLMVMIKTMSY